MPYTSYDYDSLDASHKMKIDRTVYFDTTGEDIAPLTALPLTELQQMRQESTDAEQAIFEGLQKQAKAWEEQAGHSALLRKAIEFVMTPPVKHTSNKWEKTDYDWHTRSNAVYQMTYHIYENTRYDREQQKSVPYSWSLTWSVRTNGPDNGRNVRIAGQERKTYSDKAAMEKYLAGRIKAYDHLFTEISPVIPKEYAQQFKVNGQLLPGYTVEGEEVQKAPEAAVTPEPEVSAPVQPETVAETPAAKPIIPLVISAKDPAGRMKEITDKLEDGIRGIFDSEKYAEYLRAMSKFHNYSFNNTILIAMQGGTLVKGYSQWEKEFDRHVKPGEKGIKIIAPAPFKVKQEMKKLDPNTQQPIIGADGKPVMEEKEVTIPAYKVVTVFDVSQTEGKELPSIGVNALTGDVEHFKDVLSALEKVSPVPINFEEIKGSAHGFYSLADKRIAIQEGMSQLQTLKTAIHEIAHAKLHDIDLNAPKEERENLPDQRTREVQAESVAYTVCQHYGLDTSDYSFGYVAGWSTGREMDELKSSLETIRSTAAEIINGIDARIAELQKDQEKAQEQEKPLSPDDRTTGEQISTPRGSFHVTAMSREQMEAAGYGVHHRSEDGKYLIMGNGTRAFAVPAQEAQPEQDTFTIYQLKREDATRDYRFEPYDRLHAAGLAVDPAHYEPVYSGPMTPGMTLENIYTRFNIDHPQDFKGHSLSVSDVVVVQQGGQQTAHYVDSFGYQTVPEFLQPENYLKNAEMSTEQNYNMIDGIANNAPTVGELEAKAKAGEVISLTDLATAIQAEKGQSRGREEKPSIRAQLKQYKEQTAQQKKTAKTKSYELEV
jgi:antirestriction protein ArdC